MDIILYELLSPYDAFDDSNVREFYVKNLKAKLDGYKTIYQDCLPIDSYDLICDHFLLCLPGPSGMEIACTFKAIRKSQTDRFGLKLPCFPLVESMAVNQDVTELIKSMEKYEGHFKNRGEDLYYTYSWTIDPKYRKTDIGRRLKFFSFAILKFYAEFYDCPGIMITGMEKVKTDIGFKWVGFDNFKDPENREIGHIKSPLFNNEKALMLKFDEWSDDYLKSAVGFEDIYEKRVVLGGEKDKRLKRVA